LEVKPIKINNGREVTYWVLGAWLGILGRNGQC
jgi:sulfite exporter TauE/SafE